MYKLSNTEIANITKRCLDAAMGCYPIDVSTPYKDILYPLQKLPMATLEAYFKQIYTMATWAAIEEERAIVEIPIFEGP